MLSKSYLSSSMLLECLEKYPNGITVTELMRKEPKLSFDIYTPQKVLFALRELKSMGYVRRVEKAINPKTRFILIGTTESGKTLKGRTKIERYCQYNQHETVTVKWTPIEVGEKQVLFIAK